MGSIFIGRRETLLTNQKELSHLLRTILGISRLDSKFVKIYGRKQRDGSNLLDYKTNGVVEENLRHGNRKDSTPGKGVRCANQRVSGCYSIGTASAVGSRDQGKKQCAG